MKYITEKLSMRAQKSFQNGFIKKSALSYNYEKTEYESLFIIF